MACFVLTAACGSVDKGNGPGAGASGTSGANASSSGASQLGGGASGSTSGTIDLGGLGSASGMVDLGGLSSTSGAADAAAEAGGRAKVCTDAGCTCVRIASIGHPGIYGACNGGASDGTGFFESWLNTQSSATVDTYADTKPTLTPAFLAQYDVILLQWLRDLSDAGQEGAPWQFSQAEVSALAAWVKSGGGIISLSGYDNDGQEVVPLNTLLSFTGLQYNMDGVYGNVCTGGRCWGGACALTNWNTSSAIGAHLMDIGISNGRSISVVADGGYSPVVDCPCPNGNDCAVHEDIGMGHVFAFTDEWVTYTSQWLATSSCLPMQCQGNTPADDFQVPQFWYNAISYVSQSVQCKFVINNPAIIPR